MMLFGNCWFSHDVTKIQTKNLSILPRFYFHDALEQLKPNFHTNFCFERVLGFVIEYSDLNLGEDLCISTSFHFPDSGLYLLNGFDFYFDLF